METRRRETMRLGGFANVSSSHVSARLSSIVSCPRAHAYSASGDHVRDMSLKRIHGLHAAINLSVVKIFRDEFTATAFRCRDKQERIIELESVALHHI